MPLSVDFGFDNTHFQDDWSVYEDAKRQLGGGNGVVAGSVTISGTRTLQVAGLKAIMAGLLVTGDASLEVPPGITTTRLTVVANWTNKNAILEFRGGEGHQYREEPGFAYQMPLRQVRTVASGQVLASHLTDISPKAIETYPQPLASIPNAGNTQTGSAPLVISRRAIPDYGWPMAITASAHVRVNASGNTSGYIYARLRVVNDTTNAVLHNGPAVAAGPMVANRVFQLDPTTHTPALRGPARLELVMWHDGPVGAVAISGGSGPMESHVHPAATA